MNEPEKFAKNVTNNIQALSDDHELHEMSSQWLQQAGMHGYTYNFSWMGRPIIQTPQDILALQELIWTIKPDLIVETGIAHGGSLIFSASMLELIGGDASVLGIDIDIRSHNREAIEQHPMAKRIQMIQGSSIDTQIVQQVFAIAANKEKVLVILDSNHTHAHVAQELKMYAPLVKKGSYLVVMDTAVEDMPAGSFPNRPWDKGDNPKTAVWEFLENNDRFSIDKHIEHKILITVAPDGYLQCIKD